MWGASISSRSSSCTDCGVLQSSTAIPSATRLAVRHSHCAAPHSSQLSHAEHQPPRPSRSRRAWPVIAQPGFTADSIHVWGMACAWTAGCMDDGFARAMIRRCADDVGARAFSLLRFSTGARPLDYSDITNPAPVIDPCAYLRTIPAQDVGCHAIPWHALRALEQMHRSLHARLSATTTRLRQYPRASHASHEVSLDARLNRSAAGPTNISVLSSLILNILTPLQYRPNL
jgi:hypothetical protein